MPSDYQLSVAPVYHENGDFIEVQIFVQNRLTTKLTTKEVQSGVCEIRFEHLVEIARASFDLYNGNADSAFKVFVLHPNKTRNLQAKVMVTLRNGDYLEVERDVLIEEVDESALSVNSGGLNEDGYSSILPNED